MKQGMTAGRKGRCTDGGRKEVRDVGCEEVSKSVRVGASQGENKEWSDSGKSEGDGGKDGEC